MTFLSHKSFFDGEFELEVDEVESALKIDAADFRTSSAVDNDLRGDSFVKVFLGESFLAGDEKFVFGIVPVLRGDAVVCKFLTG